MMKKFGFTLAEVLITLGIIGVVAALTAPALVQNAGTAKVGPTLSKVVATLENANEQLLHDEDATDLSKIAETNLEYSDLLSKYISGSSYETENFDSSTFEPAISHYNGDSPGSFSPSCRVFYFSDNILLVFGSGFNSDDYSYSPKGSFKGLFCVVYVDINGPKTKPNRWGKDLFYFYIDKSGQIIPVGGTTFAWLLNNEAKYTNSDSPFACNETKVGNGMGCAGSIFENNFKVIYQ